MKNLTIVNADYNTEYGFFWVEFNNGKSIQCCLMSDDEGGYLEQIDSNDYGAWEGCSADCNEWVDGKFDVEEVLFSEAKKIGLEVI